MTTPSGPTSTPIWGLEKPGGDEPVDILEAVHRNMDRLDKAGRFRCTSTTRPSTGLFDGLVIYETDTRLQWSYVAGTPGGWAYDSPMHNEYTASNTFQNNILGNPGFFNLNAGIQSGHNFVVAPGTGGIIITNDTPRRQIWSLSFQLALAGVSGPNGLIELSSFSTRLTIAGQNTGIASIPDFLVGANSALTVNIAVFQNSGADLTGTSILRVNKRFG